MLYSTSGRGKESRYRRLGSRMTSMYCSQFRSAPPPRFVVMAFTAAVITASVTATVPPISGSPVTTASNASLPQWFTNNSSTTTSRSPQPLTATSSSHQLQIIESSAASPPTTELPTMAPHYGQLPLGSPVYASSHATVLQDPASPAASSFYESPATETLAFNSAERQSTNLMPSSSPSNEALATASPATEKLQATATRSIDSPATRSLFTNASECEHPDGVLLRPSALWQFVDVSITAENATCRVTIESTRGNIGSGRLSNATGVTLDGTSHSTAANANQSRSEPRSSPMPQPLLVLRLVSWHPGSECSIGTCSRPRTAQERQQQPTPSTSSGNGEPRCVVALSFSSPSDAAGRGLKPTGDSASRSSASTLLLGDGGSVDALTTTAWTDASLNATVNVSGCCGIRLLLGYKIARARNACIVRSQPQSPSIVTPVDASSSSSYSSSSIYSPPSSESASFIPSSGAQQPSLLSSSQPSLPTPSFASSSAGSGSLHRPSPVPLSYMSSTSTNGSSTHLAFKGELLKKYTYVFAQDQKLARITANDGGGSDEDEAAAACDDDLDYELQLNPIPAAMADAALEVRIDLLAAPGNNSCRRLCIEDDCSPPLGPFNASGGRALSVRYEKHRPAAEEGSDGVCDESEYSGFTLRLLAPSNVTFAAVASSDGGHSSAESSLQTVAAGGAAAGALSLCTAAATVIALLAARRRRARRRLRRQNSAEQRRQQWHQRRKLPRQPIDNQEMAVYSEPVDFEALELRSSTVVEDSENYAEIATEENNPASSRAVGHAYYKLKRAAEAAAAAAAAANSSEQTVTAVEQSSDDEREHVYSELLS